MTPRGREPEGEVPLSNAARQAALSGAPQGEQASANLRPHRVGRRTRIQRWRAAVAELLDLQAGYTAWLDALPDSLRDTATAEALQAIVDLDLEGLDAIELTRGYGRD
jgi:hypothetical protein